MATWKTAKLTRFAGALLSLKTEAEVLAFLRDAATLEELRDLANRWEVVRQLEAGKSYRDIADAVGVSTATVTRIAHWLHHGEGGYQLVIDRQKKGS